MELYKYKSIINFGKCNFCQKVRLKLGFSLIAYAFFLLSYYLYYLALEKCLEGQFRCSIKIGWIYKKIAQVFISSFILVILFEFMFLKLITKLHLIHVFIVQLFFFIYSHGQEFYDHGLFNFLGHIIIIISTLILILPFNILMYLIKNRKKSLIFIFSSFLIFLFFFSIYFIHSKTNCKDWHMGLNNTYIENDEKKFGCQIKFPKFCPYKFGTYLLDLSKIYNIKCGLHLNGKKNTLKYSNSKYINKNTTRFGYPLTNKDPICLRRYTKKSNIIIYVKNHLLDMDNKELLIKEKDNIPEIIVDFSKNKSGELIINVNYNDTLSKERKKLEKNLKPYYENILILYFDSVSRSNGLRQLKKTLKFIEKFMKYKGHSNQLYPNEKYHSFQFLKYHSFQYSTPGNYPKMFYGNDNGKNMIRITKYLKENGYVTAFSNDMCLLDSCYPPHDMSLTEISDHEYLICDPNKRGLNDMIKKCLYDKINIAHQLEYGNQFWRKYKNNRKFLLIVNNDGHEGTLESIKYDDEYVYKFLNDLFKENLLKDSIDMIISDHGCPMPSLYFFNDFFKYEYDLPMLYILSYDKKNLSYDEQYKFLHQNQQKFITAYDIYNTIGHLIYWNSYQQIKNKEDNNGRDTPKTKFGKSIFTEIDSKRTPSDYKNMDTYTCV